MASIATGTIAIIAPCRNCGCRLGVWKVQEVLVLVTHRCSACLNAVGIVCARAPNVAQAGFDQSCYDYVFEDDAGALAAAVGKKARMESYSLPHLGTGQLHLPTPHASHVVVFVRTCPGPPFNMLCVCVCVCVHVCASASFRRRHDPPSRCRSCWCSQYHRLDGT